MKQRAIYIATKYGQKIDSVQDASYSSGLVALFAWSHEVENGTDVTFDDFVITKLPSP